MMVCSKNGHYDVGLAGGLGARGLNLVSDSELIGRKRYVTLNKGLRVLRLIYFH